MRLSEKWFLAVSLVLLLIGAWCYASNIDIYIEVDNMHPVRGYADFIHNISDAEYAQEHYVEWGESNSWVLQSLYTFLTVQDAQLDSFTVLITQALIVLAYYYFFACVPFVLLVILRVHQRRQGGNYGNHIKA